MPTLSVAFVHPDLGIGGAERLVVDAALGLKQRGHSVVFFTSHHDPNHCFQETRDGTFPVHVRGDFFPRHIAGRFHVIFAILRSLYLALWLWLAGPAYDVIVADQVSASVPILKWTRAKVLFYCHFPDKLLARRDSSLASLYRRPVDWLEEVTTGTADALAVNSAFTESIFREHFPSLRARPLEIVYPGITLEAYDGDVDKTDPGVAVLQSDKSLIVSLNRFERKKNVGLAIRAFHHLKSLVAPEVFDNLRLVVAGGYDPRVSENVQHHLELTSLATSLGLSHHTLFPNTTTPIPPTTQVLFLLSFTQPQRTTLLRRTLCLLYTPQGEHFGIVPVEAMYSRVPVVACDSGGPRESVADGVTGFLCGEDPAEWAAKVAGIVAMGERGRREMGDRARQRVVDKFSAGAMADKLDGIVQGLAKGGKRGKSWVPLLGFVAAVVALVGAVWAL
ncbi:glycosyltransferase family 4 protein [Gonapodya prolifera JEL478]|uniref:Alpha-1,3/1,6-mannosyltransferase ALG2 n=1 Tax=Gonapodya prolifera (strain JEL478) TaxID=1344416 RepID=A0A139ATW1_GONPJ|nr:glycosyltransferase family 4 protein [Gonapodya prolifera JEL478]|eukprot:KXS20147.1 glycosyltransferase family 4 protein [Gonapodya prolifera JEL478]